MTFLEVLLHDLRHGPTVAAILTWILVAALARRGTPDARKQLRAPGVMVALHVALVLLAAGLDASGYVAAPVWMTSLALALLGIIGTVQVLVFWIALPRIGVRVPRILIDVVSVVAALIALIFVGNRAGVSVAGLITTSAVLTAIIGFSMQDTLGNLMGGLALQMDSSVKVGDWISLGAGQPTGQVTEIRWRYTAIETRSWETVIVPNSVLMKGVVVVLGRRVNAPPQLRRHLEFHVDFRTPPTTVITVLQAELASDPVSRMATNPGPQVLFFAIKDSYAVYAVRYWLTDLAVDEPTDSEVRTRIYFALQRAGISLAIPAQALFVTDNNQARRMRKQREEHDRRLAAVAQVDLFEALDDEERADLADQLRYAPFARGEAVTREGDHDDGLYIIVRGDAAVRIGLGDTEHEVARLGAGSFFGEMSLMTGETRSATVLAAGDLECYRLDKRAFENLLRRRPEIAEAVADTLAVRREALASVRDQADDARNQRLATVKQDLLTRIRAFFALGDNG